jgi:hypothetical protein
MDISILEQDLREASNSLSHLLRSNDELQDLVDQNRDPDFEQAIVLIQS